MGAEDVREVVPGHGGHDFGLSSIAVELTGVGQHSWEDLGFTASWRG